MASPSSQEAPRHTYRVFLSYSNDPDYYLVRDVETYLESFHNRAGVRKLSLPKLEACRDGSDFRLPDDAAAIRNILDVYLAESEYLAVFCSRGASTSPYVAYEIRWFVEHGRVDRIRLLATEGVDPATTPEEVIPRELLDLGLHHRLWYDLRGKRARKNRNWLRVRDFDDELARFTAQLHGKSASDVYPVWQREQAGKRRQQKLAVAGMIALAVSAAGWWMWSRTNAYQAARLNDEVLIQERGIEGFARMLVEIGETKKAIDVARRQLEPGRRVDTLCAVAAALESAKRPQDAAVLYREAVADPKLWSMHASINEGCLAGALALAGENSDAGKAVEAAGTWHYESVAVSLAERGRPQEALKLARRIDSLPGRSSALIRISEKLPLADQRAVLDEAQTYDRSSTSLIRWHVAAGNIETALKMAETRPSSSLDWEPLGAWATKNNDLAVLKRIVNGIQDDNFIRRLIDNLLKAGVPDTAVALTDIAPVRNELKMELLVLIANHLTNLKQCPQALPLVQRVLQNCKRGEECGRNRIEAAENFRRCGQSDQWMAVLKPIVDESIASKEWAIARLGAVRMAEAGQVDAAMAAAAGIDATTSAGRELRLELATILARNGNERAFEFLEDSRPKDCEQVGLIFANAGNLPAVMRAANCADSRGYVSSVIRTLAKAGKYGDIRRLAATPGFLNDEPETAATMAVAMARAGAGGEALRWSAKLKDESAVRTMAAAAAILPENDPNRTKLATLALETRLSTSGDLASRTWFEVGRRFAHAKLLDEAMQASNRTTDDRETSAIRALVARRYAEAGSLLRAREVIRSIPIEAARTDATIAVERAWHGLKNEEDPNLE